MGTEPCLLPGVLPGAALARSKFWASEPAPNWVQLFKIAQLCSLCFPAWKGHRLFLVPSEPGLGVGGKTAKLGPLQRLLTEGFRHSLPLGGRRQSHLPTFKEM